MIVRDASNGRINRVNNPILNIDQSLSRGLDVEIAWRTPVSLLGGSESMAVRLLGNYAFEARP